MDVITIGETMALFTPKTMGLLRYGKDFSLSFAGAESNTAIGLARLGHSVGWISQVGKDEFGEALLQLLQGEGVDVSQVRRVEDFPTGIMIKEPLNRRELRVYYYRRNSAASQMSVEMLDENYLREAKFLYLTGVTPALSESCYCSIMKAIAIAKQHQIPVVFDPNYRSKLWDKPTAKRVLLEIVSQTDILLPGIAEGQLLVDEVEPEQMTKRLLELGVSTVVLKLGADGAYVATRELAAHVNSFKVEQVVDPVGAGDAFAAGFLSGQLDGLSLLESTRRACTVAALVVEVQGDYEGFPLRVTLERLASPVEQDVLR